MAPEAESGVNLDNWSYRYGGDTPRLLPPIPVLSAPTTGLRPVETTQNAQTSQAIVESAFMRTCLSRQTRHRDLVYPRAGNIGAET